MTRTKPKMLRNILGTLALLSLLALGGCASVPMATPQQDAAAKQFNVPPGESRIYLYRNETFGAAITMTVALDGKVMGKTASKTYFVWDVSPGRHVIDSETENDAKLTLNTVAGQPYFVWQEVKMGLFSPRSKLHLMNQQAGEKGVLECKLARPGKAGK